MNRIVTRLNNIVGVGLGSKIIAEPISENESKNKPKNETKTEPKNELKFSEMTLDQLEKYEFPRNIVEEYLYQAAETSILWTIFPPFQCIRALFEIFNPNCKECNQQMTRTLGLNEGKLICGNPHCEECKSYMKHRGNVSVRSYIQDSIKRKNIEWKEAYDKAYYAHEKQIYMNNPFLRRFDPKNPPKIFTPIF